MCVLFDDNRIDASECRFGIFPHYVCVLDTSLVFQSVFGSWHECPLSFAAKHFGLVLCCIFVTFWITHDWNKTHHTEQKCVMCINEIKASVLSDIATHNKASSDNSVICETRSFFPLPEYVKQGGVLCTLACGANKLFVIINFSSILNLHVDWCESLGWDKSPFSPRFLCGLVCLTLPLDLFLPCHCLFLLFLFVLSWLEELLLCCVYQKEN